MNKVILIGRLTKEPVMSFTQGNEASAITRYSLAVNRRYAKEGQQEADFINCVAFGKSAEFAEKYFKKGMQVAIVGRIQTGSYTDKEGVKRYTTDVVIEEQQFAEGRKSNEKSGDQGTNNQSGSPTDGFVPIEGDDDIPF